MVELEYYSKSEVLKHYSCFVLVLSGHGGEETIQGADGDCVAIFDMLEMFNNTECPHLKGKPKLFFVDTCRGSKLYFIVLE